MINVHHLVSLLHNTRAATAADAAAFGSRPARGAVVPGTMRRVGRGPLAGLTARITSVDADGITAEVMVLGTVGEWEFLEEEIA